MEFVTLYQPHQAQDKIERQATLRPVPGGYVLKAALPDGASPPCCRQMMTPCWKTKA